MYRIIKLKKVSFCQANSARMQCVDVFSLRGCSLCNNQSIKLNSRSSPGLVRNHSSGLLHTVLRYSARKKRTPKSKDKVSDMLAVDFYSVSEKRARVTPLKVNDVTRLAESSNISLQELYKLKPRYVPFSKRTPSTSSSNHVPKSSLKSMGVTLVLPPREETRRLTGAKFITFTSSPLLSDPDNTFLALYHQRPLTARDLVSDVFLSSVSEPLVSEEGHPYDDNEFNCSAQVPSTHHFGLDCDQANFEACEEILDGQESLGISVEMIDKQDNLEKQMKKFVKMSKLESKEAKKRWLLEIRKMREQRREESKEKNIGTYLDVCAKNGMLKHCVSFLTNYSEKLKKNKKVPKLLYFEIGLKGAALSGSIDSMNCILDMMRKLGIHLSLDCYAACLECLGRNKASKVTQDMISHLLEDLKTQKFSVDDIFKKCKFYGNQRSVTLEAIRTKIPDFVPVRDETQEPYKVNLLSALNSTSKAKSQSFTSPASGLFSHSSVCSWIDEQVRNEVEGIVRIPNISCSMDESSVARLLKKQAKFDNVWAHMMRGGLARDLKMLRRVHTKKSNRLYMILKTLSCDEVIDVMLQEVHLRFGDSDMFSPPVYTLYYNLGRKIKRLHDLKHLTITGSKQITTDLYKEYCKWYLDPQSHPLGPSNPREVCLHLQSKNDNPQEPNLKPWAGEILVEVGKFLYAIILRELKIEVPTGRSCKDHHAVPAFYTIFRKNGYTYQEQLKMHPSVNRLYETSGQPYIYMDCLDVPMISPPMPWVNAKQGAFPLLAPDLLRLPHGPGKRSRGELMKEFNDIPARQLYPALDALNQLGSIPWKINHNVLDVVTQVFNSGGSRELSIPLPPTSSCDNPALSASATAEEKLQYYRARLEARKQQSEMYSLWCDALYRLSLAHHFRDKIFWLPHNMDFRGRVYPIAPHLQHMSCDMSRSLLIFAEGRKLGLTGLDWLKIHTINLTGLKKKDSIAERLSYANEILDKIIDSAEHPLTGDKWWIHSDEPWQTLASCMEIRAAIRSGDPENFVSHFPVHQDGSCNGLQHYAALGRDAVGAASVNLASSERPADVYSQVAEIVERRRKVDAAGGDALAIELEGFVTRKVVKQTIMTTVYGVTRYGARLQIAGQLKDLDFSRDRYMAAATYLAGLTFDSIGEMFTSTQKIQNWLTNCANSISKTSQRPVQWITPLGLPVVQPYYKQIQANKHFKKSKLIQGDLTTSIEIPNVLKQRNGFPPNFIHSLDSCHMMLTSLFCEQSGITFVSVHDCFWIHPCNVEKMNKICREQFVALHSEPILEDLSQFLVRTFVPRTLDVENRLLKRQLLDVPAKGDFNLKEVLSSVYFFS